MTIENILRKNLLRLHKTIKAQWNDNEDNLIELLEEKTQMVIRCLDEEENYLILFIRFFQINVYDCFFFSNYGNFELISNI